jgi:hypothetical protein
MMRVLSPILVTVVVISVFVVSQPVGVEGYRFYGARWPNGTIRLYHQLGAPRRPFSDGDRSWDQVAQRAMSQWNGVIRNVQFSSRRVRGRDVPFWDGVNDVAWTLRLPARTLGLTYQLSHQGVRVESDVVFNARTGWDSYRGNLRSRAEDFRRVAFHEFGHVLGLDHPPSGTAIMRARTSNVDRLRADDIAGAQRLYGRR